jgi:hypothetical protein
MDSSPDLSLKLRRGSSDSRDSFYMDFAQGIDSDIEVEHGTGSPCSGPLPFVPPHANLQQQQQLQQQEEPPPVPAHMPPPVLPSTSSGVGDVAAVLVEEREDEDDELPSPPPTPPPPPPPLRMDDRCVYPSSRFRFGHIVVTTRVNG